MKRQLILIFTAHLVLISCNMETKNNSIEQWKQEILTTEQEFAAMAKKEGIKKAFLNYAADDVVLLRSKKLVEGKKAMDEFFGIPNESEHESLEWKPDFVDVAASGDLGYTYGKFTYSAIDSTGNKVESSGIFHTVWKKQPDKTWKFVWD
ncbi:MAG: nuclear transport factor 2 family protein [Bacteroidetes bacterium]|nr:nuclear transport factor 2 family protein [Bacteroidota bacterium]